MAKTRRKKIRLSTVCSWYFDRFAALLAANFCFSAPTKLRFFHALASATNNHVTYGNRTSWCPSKIAVAVVAFFCKIAIFVVFLRKTTYVAHVYKENGSK